MAHSNLTVTWYLGTNLYFKWIYY